MKFLVLLTHTTSKSPIIVEANSFSDMLLAINKERLIKAIALDDTDVATPLFKKLMADRTPRAILSQPSTSGNVEEAAKTLKAAALKSTNVELLNAVGDFLSALKTDRLTDGLIEETNLVNALADNINTNVTSAKDRAITLERVTDQLNAKVLKFAKIK